MLPSWDFDAYFFDLDGTIYLEDRLLPGVERTLAHLRKEGKRVMFLTNTTTQTRRQCRERLEGLGLAAELDEIVTAAYLSAMYLQETDAASLIYAVGETALMEELEAAGIQLSWDPLAATHVLVGMDRAFDYRKLHAAMKAVRNGAVLIAANPDPFCPVQDDVLPDTWSMVRAIEAASSGQAGFVIGKPSAYYARKVFEKVGVPPHRCLMVGDRLETDILFGIQNGVSTALVLTGAASTQDVDATGIRPDYTLITLEELCP
ncbi:HAD-IIA family hydrolase [Gorillibacterium timonense]|uniref:HAD-IIA family hydrolase n=1 Tax=Gorillibacterium timonense TaxID=1689269 RepID=UPI00071C3B65|nr:HAD-IIA family hydrolase [Gorillibacterium timonense]